MYRIIHHFAGESGKGAVDMIMMGHFKVRRAHDQWRVGHTFHAEVSSRLTWLTEAGFLECLGGTASIDPASEQPKARRRRGVKVRDGQTGDAGLRP